MKGCPVVENLCAHGDSFHNYIIALITPSRPEITKIAKSLNKEICEPLDDNTFKQLCNDEEVVKAAKKELCEHAAKSNLHRSETPDKIKLCAEVWTPDTGLVTAAFKIRRKQIVDYYADDIKKMYE